MPSLDLSILEYTSVQLDRYFCPPFPLKHPPDLRKLVRTRWTLGRVDTIFCVSKPPCQRVVFKSKEWKGIFTHECLPLLWYKSRREVFGEPLPQSICCLHGRPGEKRQGCCGLSFILLEVSVSQMNLRLSLTCCRI